MECGTWKVINKYVILYFPFRDKEEQYVEFNPGEVKYKGILRNKWIDCYAGRPTPEYCRVLRLFDTHREMKLLSFTVKNEYEKVYDEETNAVLGESLLDQIMRRKHQNQTGTSPDDRIEHQRGILYSLMELFRPDVNLPSSSSRDIDNPSSSSRDIDSPSTSSRDIDFPSCSSRENQKIKELVDHDYAKKYIEHLLRATVNELSWTYLSKWINLGNISCPREQELCDGLDQKLDIDSLFPPGADKFGENHQVGRDKLNESYPGASSQSRKPQRRHKFDDTGDGMIKTGSALPASLTEFKENYQVRRNNFD